MPTPRRLPREIPFISLPPSTLPPGRCACLYRTGFVVIKDNGVAVSGGTIALTGSATFLDLSALSAGTHKITATYLGDDNFKTSTSSTITVKVT